MNLFLFHRWLICWGSSPWLKIQFSSQDSCKMIFSHGVCLCFSVFVCGCVDTLTVPDIPQLFHIDFSSCPLPSRRSRCLTSIPRTLADVYHSLGTQLPEALLAVLPSDFFSDESVAKDSESPAASSLPPSVSYSQASDSGERLEDLRSRSANRRFVFVFSRFKIVCICVLYLYIVVECLTIFFCPCFSCMSIL